MWLLVMRSSPWCRQAAGRSCWREEEDGREGEGGGRAGGWKGGRRCGSTVGGVRQAGA